MITFMAAVVGFLIGVAWERYRPRRVVVTAVNVETKTITVSSVDNFSVGQIVDWLWK